MKEVITLTQEALGYESSSPCQHLKKCIEIWRLFIPVLGFERVD